VSTPDDGPALTDERARELLCVALARNTPRHESRAARAKLAAHIATGGLDPMHWHRARLKRARLFHRAGIVKEYASSLESIAD
jgi:hypothetical protein